MSMMPFPAYFMGKTDVPITAVFGFETGTSNVSTDYTIPRLAGQTAAGSLVFASNHSVSNGTTETPQSCIGVGFAEGTGTNGAALSTASGDNIADTDCSTSFATQSDAWILRPRTGANTFSTVSNGNIRSISNGIRVEVEGFDGTNRQHMLVAFGQAATCYIDSISPSSASLIDVTAPGFAPDAVICFGNDRAGAGTDTIHKLLYGIAVRDGSTTQRTVTFVEADAQAAGRPFMTIKTGAVLANLSSVGSGSSWNGVISAFDGSGFSYTPSNTNQNGREFQYMALAFGGRPFKLVDFTTPTSTGNASITGVGFRPRFAFIVLTSLEALDDYPAATSDNQGGISWSVIDEGAQWSMSTRMDSGATTIDTATLCENVALLGATATACNTIKATFVAFGDDGMTLNYSAVAGTGKKGFILFVG